MKVTINNVGNIVAIENRMSSWVGETISFWGKFDIDWKTNNFYDLRNHLVDAMFSAKKPPGGYVRVLAFYRETDVAKIQRLSEQKAIDTDAQ